MTILKFIQKDRNSTFTCTSCGTLIHSFADNGGPPICLTCRFLEEEISNPNEREAVRALINGFDAQSAPAGHFKPATLAWIATLFILAIPFILFGELRRLLHRQPKKMRLPNRVYGDNVF